MTTPIDSATPNSQPISYIRVSTDSTMRAMQMIEKIDMMILSVVIVSMMNASPMEKIIPVLAE